MTLKKWVWKETAEVLGVLGVIGSLIFVAFEIRQNTNALRSNTIQSIAHWSWENTLASAQDPDLREAVRASCSDSLTDDQRQILEAWYSAMIRIQMNRFYQVQLGIVEEDVALGLGGRGGPYSLRFFGQVWDAYKDNFAPEFQEFVESELRPHEAIGCDINATG